MHPRTTIHDPFRLDRVLLSQAFVVIESFEESQPFAGTMFLPDRLRSAPPRSQALVSVEPVRLAVHEPLPVTRNHRLEGFRDPEREDALAEQHGPDAPSRPPLRGVADVSTGPCHWIAGASARPPCPRASPAVRRP